MEAEATTSPASCEEAKIENTDVNSSSKAKRRKSKTLCEPTESMLAGLKELEKRKGEIKPEDDPFWEKRGGKGCDLLPKYKEVPHKAPRPINETLELLKPLEKSSRLLTTTKATINGAYHKDEVKKELHVTPLPQSSHLLTPTKASIAAVFTPPVTEEPPKSPVRSTSPFRENSRLSDLTAARRASAREKADNSRGVDNRELGWNEYFARSGQRKHSVPSAAPSPSSASNEGTPTASTPDSANKQPRTGPYKNVKSKLHNPTVASVRQMWVAEAPGGEVNEEVRMDPAAKAAADEEEIRRRSHSPYAYVNSRLLEPTASVRSSMWSNRPNSPQQQRQSLSPRRDDVTPPSVEGKATKAQLFNQRQKYVKHDPKDVGAISKVNPKKNAIDQGSPPYNTKPGRIYSPVPGMIRKLSSRGSSSDEFYFDGSGIVEENRAAVAQFFGSSDSFEQQSNPMAYAETPQETATADVADVEFELEDKEKTVVEGAVNEEDTTVVVLKNDKDVGVDLTDEVEENRAVTTTETDDVDKSIQGAADNDSAPVYVAAEEKSGEEDEDNTINDATAELVMEAVRLQKTQSDVVA